MEVKRMKKCFCLMLLLFINSLQLVTAKTGDTAIQVQTATLKFNELPTGRPSTFKVWYPQGNCSVTNKKQLCLADSAITNKVLIFSHGAMGSASEYSWIGKKLAASGFVVIGVNHFGESSIYGQESRNPRSTTLIWQRPQDVSALLDKLATNSIFQKNVNWSNVVAIGHSSGGQTATMLAGATFDLAILTDYCNSVRSKGDLTCSYGRNRSDAPEAFRQKFSAPQQDNRIKMMVLLDPALGPAVQKESLRQLKIPTLVVGAQNNDFLPWAQHGLSYAAEIPSAKIHLLKGQEGHFIFLNSCNRNTKVIGVPLCMDRQGADREATHATLATVINEFIRANENVFTEKSTTAITARSYSRNSPITEILMYTPHWVFGLLAALVILGLWQTRTRTVSLPVAFILPTYMLITSFTGVLSHAGATLLVVASWLIAATISTSVSLVVMDKHKMKYALNTHKLLIQGSWWPLLIILGIFITRFALGVATGMELAIIHHPYFPMIVAFVLGSWSGFFIARSINFWRAYQLAQHQRHQR
jgi:predicted dienelactone hydrolase